MRAGNLDCTVPDCDRKQWCKGMCGRHYMLNKRNGSPLIQVKTSDGALLRWLETEARNYEGDECLQWPFATAGHGYGQVKIGKTHYGAHRIVCEWENGPPPTPEHEAAHSCGNGHKGCVNRRHLSWKTRKENAEDRTLHMQLKIGRYAETETAI